MQDHEIASIFPLMPQSELEDLAADIKANGLIEPVTVYEDKILDGRNRFRACAIVKVEPRFEQYIGKDPLTFIISANLHRRHLNTSQRAMVGARLANLKDGQRKSGAQICAPVTQPDAAKAVNVSRRMVQTAKAVLDSGNVDLAAEVEAGRITVADAVTQLRKIENEKALITAQARITEEARRKLISVCDIRHCSMQQLFASGITPDCVITDPPYPQEFLPLYGELAELATNVPLVAVMSGQSWLPEVMALMCKHLTYRWTCAYLTPGPAFHAWHRKVDCRWKPILLFGESDLNICDVFKSEKPDKDHHDWGQSESGMADLVERLSKPGQLVCDPFLGAGTTALVSLRLGRRFVGCDIDVEATTKAIRRCEAFYARSA